MGSNTTISGNRICSASKHLDAVKKLLDRLNKNWNGFSDDIEKLERYTNNLWTYWIDAIEGDHCRSHELSKTIDMIEVTLGNMAKSSLESPHIKPAKKNPEDYVLSLKEIRQGVRDFILIMSRDMLDILEDRVDGTGRDLSKADRSKPYGFVLDYRDLTPSIKKGLSYYDSKNMLMDPKDYARVEKLEQAVKALKSHLEKPPLDGLKKLGLRS